MGKGRNNAWMYITSTIFFIGGAGAAYQLVHNFCSHTSKQEAGNNPKKDTIETRIAAILPTDIPNTDTKTPAITSSDVSQLQPQKGRQLTQNNPLPIPSTQAVINAAALSHTYTLEQINSGKTWIAAFGALAILLIAFFAKKDSILNAKETDKDPADLQQLFTEFKSRIELFRNPRKILRFLNLVKYHYYFLCKNDMETMDNLNKMMWILLEIQDDPELLHIDGVDRQKLSTPVWFYNKIKTKPWFWESGIQESDHDLLMIILKLNVDMGA
jgi:hypothetical protein